MKKKKNKTKFYYRRLPDDVVFQAGVLTELYFLLKPKQQKMFNIVMTILGPKSQMELAWGLKDYLEAGVGYVEGNIMLEIIFLIMTNFNGSFSLVNTETVIRPLKIIGYKPDQVNHPVLRTAKGYINYFTYNIYGDKNL